MQCPILFFPLASIISIYGPNNYLCILGAINPREDMVHQKVAMESQEVYRIIFGLQQKTFKYLGVLIGEDLTFSEHLKRLKGKLISASFMLNQSKSFLPFKARLQAYSFILESHLNCATIF